MMGLFIWLSIGWAVGHYIEYMSQVPDVESGKPLLAWVWSARALDYWYVWWLAPQFIPFVPAVVKMLAIGATVDGMLEWTATMYDKWIASFVEAPTQIVPGQIGPVAPN